MIAVDNSQPINQQQESTLSRNDSTKESQQYVPLKAIGNYTFQQSIGKGSMGKVKLAVHNVTGEKIAIKIVPRANLQIMNQTVQPGKSIQQIAKEKAREENREVRTIREAHIMMLLKHPNIVKMKDITPHGPYFYILMDYVNGGQLLHYIVKRQRLSDRRTRHFTRQIVSALDYLHRNSIVHRDLKIENIMVDKSGRNVKIIDFGLSNLFCPERQLTTFCGSLYFAAPELLRANPYNGPEVDIWSLGVVIYVMATGSVPFDDKSMPGLHEKIKRGHVNYPAHLTEDCKDLLSRIFITDPTQRIIMTDIIHHPWINKEATIINSHMPVRKPITLPLNQKVLERMSHGFNIGTPEEIEKRLTLILQSPVYHNAADHIANCQARKPQNSASHIVYDDPQSVPAAYHPFISLYYLASEKLAAIEQEAHHHHHRVSIRSSLSRKASIESLGGYSSARSSQASLVGTDNEGPPQHQTTRLLTDVPLNQAVPHQTGKSHNGSFVGFESAAISSTNYLVRIQRWLRSSLSQHHLATHEPQVSAPPSPPTQGNDNRSSIISQQELQVTEELPTPVVTNEQSNPEERQTPIPGSKSLFRKLSHAILRKTSTTKSIHKKPSTLSSTSGDDQEETKNEVVVHDVPPPLPPKDYTVSYMVSPPQQQQQQIVPPGMSVATVTSRQTAHTVDLNSIQPKVPNHNNNNINNNNNTLPTPTISKSSSLLHRRRGSVSKIADKMNNWLHRSNSLNKTEA